MSNSVATPTLLIAMPQIQDPFFRRGVVLLVDHDEEGSFGFVVNRSTDLKVASVLSELKIDWGGNDEMPALLGGPVNPQLGTVLMPSNDAEGLGSGQSLEIAPGISITQNVESLRFLATHPPHGFRLILGYAGWSPGQLEEEIERHDWLTCPVDSDLVFSQQLEGLWDGALMLLGIRPGDLPEWTDGSASVN